MLIQLKFIQRNTWAKAQKLYSEMILKRSLINLKGKKTFGLVLLIKSWSSCCELALQLF